MLRGDGRRVWRHFRPSYRWLMQQMARRLDCYRGGWPVWFWITRTDLRSRALLPKGTRGVRLELSIPRERALLLDFDTWHIVLNNGYLALTEQEDDAWDREALGLVKTAPETIRKRVHQSWERVFDLKALQASAYAGGPDLLVQGVAEYFLWEEVVDLKSFHAR